MKNVLALTLCLCAAQIATGAEPAAKPKVVAGASALQLSATLVTDKGAPIEGAYCTVSKEGGGFEIKDGVVLNPSAESDAHGRLKFEIGSAFMPANRRITIGCTFPKKGVLQNRPLRDKQGVPITFQFGPGEKSVDLEKVIGKIIVSDV